MSANQNPSSTKPDANADFQLAREISPRRSTTGAVTIEGLVAEQLKHFGVDPAEPFGERLASLALHLYRAQADTRRLWDETVAELAKLSRRERIERFAAMKFLSFQLAKILDTLQNPSRRTYQSLVRESSDRIAKGPYPIFDNVTAIFASRPVITRTATYIYACAEWVEDAFQGKDLLLEIYSRLLNPTSITLANQIVDIEAGPLAPEYLAWNFNSGMAAVDAILSHLVGYQDVILSSRNIYGGTYQLMHDWFGKKSNLDVALHFFDGCGAADFRVALAGVIEAEKHRLAAGRKIYVFLESPCNPHGYVLDVAEICREAHEHDIQVICDSTVGTPFLHRPLRRDNPSERPDFIVHSYTKDIAGHGGTTAGVVIGRGERMFMSKHSMVEAPDAAGKLRKYPWDETLFWNVYYIKGAFLDADKAFEVLTGMHTLEMRMLRKAINTLTLAECLALHPEINVNCSAVPGHPNAALREKCLYLGLPAPLFTFDFEGTPVDRTTFQRFFDCLEPAFGHQVSLGQPNTVVLCPAITSHSELSPEALAAADIRLTTTRVAVGYEDPRSLLAHLQSAAELTIDQQVPGFSRRFLAPDKVDAIFRRHYLDVHRRYVEALPSMEEFLQ